MYYNKSYLGKISYSIVSDNGKYALRTALSVNGSHQLRASCSRPCDSVTKQYNLAPMNWRLRSAVGKITEGISQWPCVTDFSRLTIYGLTAWPIKGEMNRWRRGVTVTSLGVSTKLLYVGPG